MSTNRVKTDAGWVQKTETGPNGRPTCRWCKKEIEKGTRRRTFCSDECVNEWKIRSDPGHARRRVYERDGGICALCKVNTEGAKAEGIALLGRLFAQRTSIEWRGYFANSGPSLIKKDQSHPEWLAHCAKYRLKPDHNPYRAPWHADHRIPVVEGGGECGLDNLRTLCIPCHQDVTRKLRKRIAQRKKGSSDNL